MSNPIFDAFGQNFGGNNNIVAQFQKANARKKPERRSRKVIKKRCD